MRIDTILSDHAALGYQHPYIKHIIARIYDLEVTEYSEKDYEEYCALVPDNILECFKLHLEVNFDLRIKYLVILIYHVLSKDPQKDNIIAVGEFFMCGLQNINREVPQSTFDIIFEKILEEFDKGFKIPIDTVMRFHGFITSIEYDLLRHIEEIIILLKNVIGDNNEVFDLENGLKDNSREVNIGFMTLKKLFEKYRSLDKDLSNIFSYTLIAFCKNNSLINSKENFFKFFKQFLRQFHQHSWFKQRFLRAMMICNDPMITVRLLKLCVKDVYNALILGIINHYITCTCDHRPYLQATMSLIISDPYKKDDYNDPLRQKIVDRIVHEIFLRLGSSDIVEREAITNTFIEWYESKDINLRRTLQQMYNDNVEMISTKKLISILERSVDIYWENETFNIVFIKLLLSIFYSKPQYIFNRSVRIVEKLCFTAMASQIEDCLPFITKIIIKYGDKNVPVLKPLIAILVNFALVQTQTGKKILFEIHNLIHNAFVKNQDADVEFGVLSILISPDMRGKEIFTALELYFPIKQDQLMILFEERTLKYGPVAWPFLCMLLEKYDLNIFPIHFYQFLIEIDHTSFYTRPEAIYIIQTIHKVLKSKMRHNISEEDKALASKIFNIFSSHIMTCIVPSRLANDVSLLLASLCDLIGYDCPKLKLWREEILKKILTNNDLEHVPIITRRIAYLAHLLIPFKMNLHKPETQKIREIITHHDGINDFVLAKLILLYGRMCLKHNSQIVSSLPIFGNFLEHDNHEVQMVTLASLYDISKLRLQDFNVLNSHLLKLITSRDPAIKDATLKLFMELLSSNHIRLKHEEAVVFLLAVVDKNLNVDMFLKDAVEKEHLMKSEGMIKSCFVYLFFYINDFRDVPKYKVSLRLETTYTYEKRCLIYRYLFNSLQRQDQLYILTILSDESIYRGEFELNSRLILRDVVTLISYFATENAGKIVETKEFYEKFKTKLEDLTKIKFDEDSVEIEFNEHLCNVLKFLLKTVLKVEKSLKEMLPQIYNAIALLTSAYYKNVTSIVNVNKKIRNLYCIYNTLFDKYQNKIFDEPISCKFMVDQEEFKYYLQLDL